MSLNKLDKGAELVGGGSVINGAYSAYTEAQTKKDLFTPFSLWCVITEA